MTTSEASSAKHRSFSWKLITVVVVMAAAAFAYAKLGLYSIQPIGAIPEGATAIV